MLLYDEDLLGTDRQTDLVVVGPRGYSRQAGRQACHVTPAVNKYINKTIILIHAFIVKLAFIKSTTGLLL